MEGLMEILKEFNNFTIGMIVRVYLCYTVNFLGSVRKG